MTHRHTYTQTDTHTDRQKWSQYPFILCGGLNDFYTSTKSLRVYIFTAVCLCVCLCVCLSICLTLLVNKIQAKRILRFGRIFRKMVANGTSSYPIEIGDLWTKVKSQWRNIHFFLPNSLLTLLLWISPLLRPIKMEFGRFLRYAFGRFMFEFDKNPTNDDVIVTSFKFSPYKCQYFQFYWTYKLQFWYKVNKHSTTEKKNPMIKVQVTFTKAEVYRWRSKFT